MCSTCFTSLSVLVFYQFFISNDLTQMVNFPTRIPDYDSHILLFWIYFCLVSIVFVLQSLSLHWEILTMLLFQFPLTFHQSYNGKPRFMAYLMTILVLIGMVLVIIGKMFHGRISLNLVFLVLLLRFVSGFRLELIYIYLKKNIRSSLIHLHGLHVKNKSSDSKVKFRQAGNRCKRILEASEL